MDSGLFCFWRRFGSVTGFFKPAPSPKPRQKPKILAPNWLQYYLNRSKVRFKGVIVGDYAADLFVVDKIIVELKTDAVYQSVHEAQLLNELRGTGIRLGFLINFGREKVEYKRMVF